MYFKRRWDWCLASTLGGWLCSTAIICVVVIPIVQRDFLALWIIAGIFALISMVVSYVISFDYEYTQEEKEENERRDEERKRQRGGQYVTYV